VDDDSASGEVGAGTTDGTNQSDVMPSVGVEIDGIASPVTEASHRLSGWTVLNSPPLGNCNFDGIDGGWAATASVFESR
jgi:hypothetical protein